MKRPRRIWVIEHRYAVWDSTHCSSKRAIKAHRDWIGCECKPVPYVREEKVKP